MTTIETRLTDEEKHRILAEVERKRRRHLIIRSFDEAFGEKAGALTHVLLPELPILARLDPQKFAELYTVLIESGYTNCGYSEGGYATLGYQDSAGKVHTVSDLLRELAPIDSHLFRKTWEYLVINAKDLQMETLGLKEPRPSFLSEKRRVAETLDALGRVHEELLVDILSGLSEHPILDDIFEALVPAFSIISGMDFELFAKYYNHGLSSSDNQVKRETAKSIRKLAESDKEKFIELYHTGVQHLDEQVCGATASTLDALASVDPEQFVALFDWSMQQSRIVKTGLAHCIGALAPINKEKFVKYYEELMGMRMASFLDFYPWLLDLGALAPVDTEQFVQLYRKWPIARKTEALVALADVGPERFIELYNEFHDDDLTSSDTPNHKVVQTMLKLLATRDVERFIKIYKAYTSKYGDDATNRQIDLLAPLAEAAPEKFGELCRSVLLDEVHTLNPEYLQKARITAKALKLLPKIDAGLFCNILDFYQKPKGAWEVDDKVLEETNGVRERIEKEYQKLRIIVAETLPTLVPVRSDYFLWHYYDYGIKDRNPEIVIKTAEALEALADVDPKQFRKMFERGIRHSNLDVQIGTLKSLGKLALLDAHRCFEVYEEFSHHPRANVVERLGSAISGLARTIDQEDQVFIRDASYEFCEAYLNSPYILDETGKVKEKQLIIDELGKVAGKSKQEYERLTQWVQDGKAKDLDDILECDAIRIPGYTIVRKLGEGGSGKVYLAQKEHSGVPRKIKIFKTRDLHPLIEGQRERRSLAEIVANEADVLAEIQHPNIVRYFDHGVVSTQEGQTFYMVAEYVDGTTVEEALPDLNSVEQAQILKAITSGMKHLHEKGYALRDLKLNNILLARERRTIKINDLETMTRIGELSVAERVTHGSDKYAAPEIMRGEKATQASDLYALGACWLYLYQGKVGDLEHINTLPEKKYEIELNKILNELIFKGATDFHAAHLVYADMRSMLHFRPEERKISSFLN